MNSKALKTSCDQIRADSTFNFDKPDKYDKNLSAVENIIKTRGEGKYGYIYDKCIEVNKNICKAEFTDQYKYHGVVIPNDDKFKNHAGHEFGKCSGNKYRHLCIRDWETGMSDEKKIAKRMSCCVDSNFKSSDRTEKALTCHPDYQPSDKCKPTAQTTQCIALFRDNCTSDRSECRTWYADPKNRKRKEYSAFMATVCSDKITDSCREWMTGSGEVADHPAYHEFMKAYCRDNLDAAECEQYCKKNDCSFLGERCGEYITGQEPAECACFLEDSVYEQIGEDLKRLVNMDGGLTVEPKCVYKKCKDSTYKRFGGCVDCKNCDLADCVEYTVGVDGKVSNPRIVDEEKCKKYSIRECSDDSNCNIGQACVNGICEKRNCVGESDCPDTQVCLDGLCHENCANKPCQTGYTCMSTGECKEIFPCDADSDCGAGEYCNPRARQCWLYQSDFVKNFDTWAVFIAVAIVGVTAIIAVRMLNHKKVS
jgi:hypothetical protein